MKLINKNHYFHKISLFYLLAISTISHFAETTLDPSQNRKNTFRTEQKIFFPSARLDGCKSRGLPREPTKRPRRDERKEEGWTSRGGAGCRMARR